MQKKKGNAGKQLVEMKMNSGIEVLRDSEQGWLKVVYMSTDPR